MCFAFFLFDVVIVFACVHLGSYGFFDVVMVFCVNLGSDFLCPFQADFQAFAHLKCK